MGQSCVGGEHPRAIHSIETVGAVPVCPPEHPRSGVSIREIGFVHHASCHAGVNDGCALVGRHGRAHRHRPYQTPPNHTGAITSSHCTFDSPRQSHGVFIPHRIAHSIAPNHAVCHYPIGVVLFLITHHYHTRQMISPHENCF